MRTGEPGGERFEVPLGDAEAAQLLQQLRAAVATVCPYVAAAERDDLVQLAVMRVLNLLRKSAERREYSFSYLRRVAYSVFIDEMRSRQRAREEPLSGDGTVEHPGDGPGPERRALSREVATGLRDCLRGLISPRRRATVLHLQGHTVSEIAKLLSFNFKRAENLVYRGLADLRHCLAAKGITP
jgi:RNA polymerase sigma-70 factor (ECF subfamily)